MKLLIVEDEQELCISFEYFFVKQNAIINTAKNKFEAEDFLITHQYDVVILDITLPDGSGLDLIKLIQSSQENAGILIVSAKNSLNDKITGLDLGADDYISKPFHLSELNSRVNALIRRKNYNGSATISFHEININTTQNQAYANKKTLSLTKKEYALLLYFLVNKNRVLTKESIAEHLWEEEVDFINNFDFIYTHIKNLRKKILTAGGKDYLKTVHGIGYKYADS